MKKYLVFSLFLITFNLGTAQKFILVKCISGDCLNGIGMAKFTAPPKDYFSDTVIYNGHFKDGKMSGQGTISNINYYYDGTFESNFYRDYGTLFFQTKKIGNAIAPDSSHWVKFYKWDEDGCNINLTLTYETKDPDHLSVNNNHKKFWLNPPFKDAWIMQHVKEMLASSARSHAPRTELRVIAQKNINAQRGRPATLIAWDCLADRQYYVTASATANGKFTTMPFSGYVNYQVTAEGGAVVFEGPVDKYWTPLKDGKYTFTIKFDQGQIVGNGNEYVDGVSLGCSLRSRQQF